MWEDHKLEKLVFDDVYEVGYDVVRHILAPHDLIKTDLYGHWIANLLLEMKMTKKGILGIWGKLLSPIIPLSS